MALLTNTFAAANRYPSQKMYSNTSVLQALECRFAGKRLSLVTAPNDGYDRSTIKDGDELPAPKVWNLKLLFHTLLSIHRVVRFISVIERYPAASTLTDLAYSRGYTLSSSPPQRPAVTKYTR